MSIPPATGDPVAGESAPAGPKAGRLSPRASGAGSLKPVPGSLLFL